MIQMPPRFEDEYPEAAKILVDRIKERALFGIRHPHINMPIILGERNSPCACGSGLKTKKCCLLVQSVTDWSAWSMHITLLSEKPCNIKLGNRLTSS
jgi:hypothetical protein